MRVRIDGTVYELENVPALDARRKHTIEAVVDRIKVRADVSQRLAESFETALRIGDGVARVALLDAPQREGKRRAELVFSNKFACAVPKRQRKESKPS